MTLLYYLKAIVIDYNNKKYCFGRGFDSLHLGSLGLAFKIESYIGSSIGAQFIDFAP